ncbi:hypothetical protein ACQEV4_22280 [Streptomyces shenzhenensis]|uniref:hypothetical protein n=1 Tax=Streptomyces shenzhenensis TaxID=943815 RepID=UPI003D8F50A7
MTPPLFRGRIDLTGSSLRLQRDRAVTQRGADDLLGGGVQQLGRRVENEAARGPTARPSAAPGKGKGKLRNLVAALAHGIGAVPGQVVVGTKSAEIPSGNR